MHRQCLQALWDILTLAIMCLFVYFVLFLSVKVFLAGGVLVLRFPRRLSESFLSLYYCFLNACNYGLEHTYVYLIHDIVAVLSWWYQMWLYSRCMGGRMEDTPIDE